MTNVMTLDQNTPKHFKREAEHITFTEDDSRKVQYAHNDPLVVTV